MLLLERLKHATHLFGSYSISTQSFWNAFLSIQCKLSSEGLSIVLTTVGIYLCAVVDAKPTTCVFTKITIFLRWCAGTFFQCNVWSLLCFQYHSQPSLPYHFSFLSVFPNSVIFRTAFACCFAVWAALHTIIFVQKWPLLFETFKSHLWCCFSHLYNIAELLCMDP